jgi:GGDEF domain-containing protein
VDPLLGLEIAFDKNEAVIRNLQDASERLTAMDQALLNEIRDRTMANHQLAAAVEQEEGSRNAALHDNLTGLPNRVLFKDRVEQGIAQSKRHRWMLAVMFVDLRGGRGFLDGGVSGFLPGQYSNRRAEIHEETKT